VCSPNNPTGNVVDNDTLAQLAEKLGNDALLVIDEAYIEFSSFPSFCRRLPEFPNVVVLRTLSKAWGLAGVRCGVALAHPKIIELLQKVRAPYPISTPALQAATDLLSSPRQSESLLQIAELVQLRKNLKENLENLTYVERVFDSHANFLLLKVKNAARLVSTCAERGIILRDRSQDLGLDNCVRITVGTVAENKAVVQVIEELGYVVG
jgi:histidinol-phosphate aminotransferase